MASGISSLFATPVPTNAAVPISDGSGAANESLNDWVTSGSGGSGTPGGASTEVQYNNAGAFGGIPGATSNGTNVDFASQVLRATYPHFLAAILDVNGAEYIVLAPMASAANHVTLANAAAGQKPSLSASGDDADVGLDLNMKGAGQLRLQQATSGGLQINQTSSGQPYILWQISGTNYGLVGVNNGAGAIITGSADHDLCLRSISAGVAFSGDNGMSVGMRIDPSNNVDIPNSGLKTANPSGGTAARWRFGSLQTNYAEADIAGTAVRLARSTRTLIPLFDHFADASNVTTTETDLYSDTIAAAQLGANGDKLELEYGGIFVSSATATRQIKIYFGGTAIFDTGALTLSLSSAWTAFATIIRVSSTVVRYMISLTTEGAALSAYTATGELTGLTLSGTNIAKITGQAGGVGAASADITAKLASVSFMPAA